MANKIQSGLLDQILLDDIARTCPTQFLAFHQCMSKPVAESGSCTQEQMNLSKCIRTEVVSFQKIQGVCAGKLQAYEACLKINGPTGEGCEKDLETLRDCALGSLDRK